MGDQLKPFVQDALDEIEYVTGDASTEWGARRVQDGHPAPFKLTYVEIGNEDDLGGGQRTYNERFGAFYEAIKAKYPNLQIISTIKPNRNQPNFSNLSHKPDVVDDHMYSPAEGTMRNANRHDRFPRDSGVKVFMGEWATNGNGQGTPTPNLRAGLADAAFLGGLERNSDLVIMECYAPLFVNVNQGARQWPTNLIGYDGLTSFGSPSYYVQKMYRDNAGDRALPVELTNVEPLDKPEESSNGRPQGPPAPMYATALRDTASGDVVVRVINTESVPRAVKINLEGVSTVAKDATVDFLSGKPTEVNTLDDPKHIVPQQAKIDNAGTSFVHEFPGYSVSIVRLKTK
jgi:alpha-N-arabinofuranosidase